jgi:hypothetical protein
MPTPSALLLSSGVSCVLNLIAVSASAMKPTAPNRAGHRFFTEVSTARDLWHGWLGNDPCRTSSARRMSRNSLIVS